MKIRHKVILHVIPDVNDDGCVQSITAKYVQLQLAKREKVKY